MDPFSISASAAGIAALAAAIIKNVAQFVAGVSNADDSLTAFQKSIALLEQVLENLERSFDRPLRPNSLGNCQTDHIHKIMISCSSYLFIIKKKLPRCPDDARAFKHAYNQLKTYVQSSLITSIHNQLQIYTQMLQLSLTEVVAVGQRENNQQQLHIQADVQQIKRQTREILTKFQHRRRTLQARSTRSIEQGHDGEIDDDMLQIESIADDNVEGWVASTISLADLSGMSFDLTPLEGRHTHSLDFDAKSETSDFNPEPGRNVCLPLDMMTSLIERLQRQAGNKMKAGMLCEAEHDQRRAIQLLKQRESFHNKPFSDRAELEEVLAEILFKMNTVGSFEEAKKILQRLLQEEITRSPRRSRLYHLLAEMYTEQGKLSDALPFAIWAVSDRKELPEVQASINESAKLLEKIYRGQGDLTAAAAVKESIVEIKPPTSHRTNSLHSCKASEEEFYRWLGDHHDPATGRSQIQQAISMENVGIVSFILDESSFTLESRDANGATPLLLASATKNSRLVDCILQHDPDVGATDRVGDTALHSVQSNSGGVKTADLLLSHREPVCIDQQNHESENALHLAVRLGNYLMVELLLRKGADVNAKTLTGRTPLHTAVETQRGEEVVSLLLREGADIEALDNGRQTPLQLAYQMRRRREPIPQKSLSLLELKAKEPQPRKSVSSAGKESMQSKTNLRRHATTSSRSSEGSEMVIVARAGTSKELPALPPETHEPLNLKDWEYC